MKSTYETIRITQVLSNREFRYRESLDVDELARSIEEGEQLVPIIVRRRGNRYQLISGFRRLAAMKKLGRETIQAKVLEDVSDTVAHRISLEENIKREDLTAWEKVSAALKLREFGQTNAEVAAGFGVNVRTIQRYLFVARNATKDFARALTRNDITCQQAYEALKKGVPLKDLVTHGRSVRYLRGLSHAKKKDRPLMFRRSRDGDVQIRIPFHADVAERRAMIQDIRARLDKFEAELSDDK